MTNKLVEELKDLVEYWSKEPEHKVSHTYLVSLGKELISRHAKVEEPLAVLAERHNWPFVYYRRRVNPNDGPYTIELSDGYHIGREFRGDTYALAEAKARAYLEGLDDVKGGVV